MIAQVVLMKKLRYRLETTNWNNVDYSVPNHIYMTHGTDLYGYINIATGEKQMFVRPMKQWSVKGRTFKDIKDSEVGDYIL